MSEAQSSEAPIWSGGPSQAVNAGPYALCVLLCVLVVPIFYALALYFKTKARRYTLTSERLLLTQGVFSKTTDGLELYRVRDGRVEEPFMLRMFGVGNVILMTSDETHKIVVLQAVPEPLKVWEKLRAQVEAQRAKKGVRDVDVS